MNEAYQAPVAVTSSLRLPASPRVAAKCSAAAIASPSTAIAASGIPSVIPALPLRHRVNMVPIRATRQASRATLAAA